MRQDAVKLDIGPIGGFSHEDLTSLRRLSLGEDWPHSIEDWQTIISSGEVFGHRDATGRILSSAAVIPYGPPEHPQLAALGMVIVDSAARRRGLGQALVQEAIGWATARTPAVPLSLIATQIGLPLYEKLGFRTVEMLHKFVRPAGSQVSNLSSPAQQRDLREVTGDHQRSLLELDTSAFGYQRARFLEARIKQAQTGRILFEGDRAVAYGLLVRQGPLTVLGPLVASDDEAAITVLTGLMECSNGPFRIDLPARQRKLFPALQAMGFVEDDVPPIMLRGIDSLRGEQQNYYAIAAQAFG